MATLAREHYDAVYRFCARRVGIEWAADTAQDTFLTAQKALPRFRGESSPRTWLLGIAHNECRRIYRQRRVEPPTLELDPERSGDADGERTIVDREALRGALARLSDDHREVVMLHEVEGLTYEEASSVLGIPVGTVKSRLHHAFLNLRREVFGGAE
ncbi:RNA polymerase sigma factor [bacterium]|nr:MAG: RNA polymerase sigma factor [bacterium]